MNVVDYMHKQGWFEEFEHGLYNYTDPDKAATLIEKLHSEWTMVFNTKALRRLGRCSYRKQTIEVHTVLFEEQYAEDHKNTFFHEIAHFICFELYENYCRVRKGPMSAHGLMWRRTFAAFGFTPSRTGSNETLANLSVKRRERLGHNHVYKCDTCSYEHKTVRKLKETMRRGRCSGERHMIHVKCGGRIMYDRKL